jgi:AraC-like DNA-binding protein
MTMLVEREAKSIGEFHSLIENTYYHSESTLVGGLGRAPYFRLDSTLAGLLPVSRFYGIDMSVRRKWAHIRDKTSELYVLWFPLEGVISVTQDQAYEQVAGDNNFVITCGDRPFHIRAVAHGPANCSQLHVLVPSHIIRPMLPNLDKICGQPFSAGSGASLIAREIFKRLITEAEDTSSTAATKLGMAGLEAIAESVKQLDAQQSASFDVKQLHLERVLRYIQQHLSSQGLTAERVAEACKISRRYFHYVMRYNNTTFGEYLWDARLKQANEWLTDDKMRHFNIVDIAYMCGFRSASHFTNSFRARFGHSPRDVRSAREH